MRRVSEYTRSKSVDPKKFVKGVISDPSLRFTYTAGDNRVTRATTQIIPVEFVGSQLHGLFSVDGALTNMPIGFRRGSQIYNVNKSHALKKGKRKRGVVYLPLNSTDIQCNAGKGASWSDGSFSYVWGVGAEDEVFSPVALVFQTGKGIIEKGIYESTKRTLHLFPHDHATSPLSDRLLDNLETLIDRNKVVARRTTRRTTERKVDAPLNLDDPQHTISYLDREAIKQRLAKEKLAVALSKYAVRKDHHVEGDIDLDPVLLFGPTGVGKTLLAQSVANYSGLPFVRLTAAGASAVGYRGGSLGNRLVGAVRKVTRAKEPYLVAFIDEVDKIGINSGRESDDFGAEIQSEMLHWFEGGLIEHDETEVQLNPRNIQFILAGLFRGLDDIVMEDGGSAMGFGNVANLNSLQRTSLLSEAKARHFMRWGFTDEFAGRTTKNIAALEPLTTADFATILSEFSHSPLRQECLVLNLRGYNVNTTPRVPHTLASYCTLETGARALKSICADAFLPIHLDPNKYTNHAGVIRITPQLIRRILGPPPENNLAPKIGLN